MKLHATAVADDLTRRDIIASSGNADPNSAIGLAASLADRSPLEVAIHERIESRLLGRIRNLCVRVVADVVTLEGQCATYYTKQLAQHAAMGIIENEQLENAIVVAITRYHKN